MTSMLLAALALAGATVVADAATPTPPPSIAQLCAATSVQEVDQLLRGVATSDLVGTLSPLVSLTVPDASAPELDASVQLEDVRARLNCDAKTTTTAAPTPTTTPEPGTPDDGDGYEQVDEVPRGGVATGDGSLA